MLLNCTLMKLQQHQKSWKHFFRLICSEVVLLQLPFNNLTHLEPLNYWKLIEDLRQAHFPVSLCKMKWMIIAVESQIHRTFTCSALNSTESSSSCQLHKPHNISQKAHLLHACHKYSSEASKPAFWEKGEQKIEGYYFCFWEKKAFGTRKKAAMTSCVISRIWAYATNNDSNNCKASVCILMTWV